MIDPAAECLLQASRSTPSFDRLGLEEARALVHQRPRGTITEVLEVRDVCAPQVPVPVRVYRPSPGPLPAVVFAHSGGWVLGSIETADETARRIAVGTGCLVVSVDYRLAPEHPHPAAVEDVAAVVDWVLSDPDSIGARPGSLCLAGESSGAHVAAAAALLRRWDDLAGLLLICPPVDPAMASESWDRLGEDFIPVRPQMKWMWDLYLGADGEHANGAPDLVRADFRDLPPTVVMVAEFDPLRDEGVAFAERAQAVGVPVVLIEAQGQLHPVAGHAPFVPACADYLEEAARAVRAFADRLAGCEGPP